MLKWTLHLRIGRGRMVVFMLLSSAFAIIMPYIYMYLYELLIIYKIATFSIMTLVIKKYRNIGEYLTYLIVAILYSSMLAGLCYGLISIMGLKTTNNSICINGNFYPMGIFILIIYLASKIFKKLLSCIYLKVRQHRYRYDIELIDDGNSVKAVGYFDSGNCVRYGSNGVSIVSLETLQKLHKNITLIDVIKQKTGKLKSEDIISINTVGGTSKYLSCVIDQMKINNHIIDTPRIVISPKKFNDFDVILNKDVLGDI